MHRFYLPSGQKNAAQLRLEGREAHHAINVLRVQLGERVSVLNGAGLAFLCTVAEVSRQAVNLAVEQEQFTPPPPCPITLLVAIPKGKIIESIIQKAVELGTHRVVPLLSDRVVTQLDDEGSGQKREKWQQVAVEAMKQCGTTWLPRIESPQSIDQFLATKPTIELALVGSLIPPRLHPRACLAEFEKRHGRRPHSAGIWIGPEGDFTPEELQVILNSGAQPITLGSLTLRVETASIYGLAILKHELGDGDMDEDRR